MVHSKKVLLIIHIALEQEQSTQAGFRCGLDYEIFFYYHLGVR